MRIEDSPWGYKPSRGLPVVFQISYRQRGAVQDDDNIFNLGPNWSCSIRSFVAVVTNNQNEVQIGLHIGGAGVVGYDGLGKREFWMGDSMSMPDPLTCYLDKPDGSRDIYSFNYTNSVGQQFLFLTQRLDPAGNSLSFNYTRANGGATILLTSITDADGRSSAIYYNSGGYSNRIDHITDPYGRTCHLYYDGSGFLTNVTDVQSLPSTFAYGATGITSMTTPYGTTSFDYGGYAASDESGLFTAVNGANRYALITQPDGGHQLYVFREDCSGLVASSYSPVPSTSPLTNTFDTGDQSQGNSFHWGPLQYSLVSTSVVDFMIASDYALARQRHWLIDGLASDQLQVSVAVNALSTERAPTQDGTNAGQVTWYDYPNQPATTNIGSSALPRFVARVLPSGETAFDYNGRNQSGNVTTDIQTYSKSDGSVGLRTNNFAYAANAIDVTLHTGPNAEQVSSNVFNTYHQVTTNYDALNLETRYTYSANHQVTSVKRPSGLTTTNIYFTSGASAGWLDTTIDLEIGRTNSYTYANGLVYSHTDERRLTTTNYWDNLQRLTGVLYPDGSTVSNLYTVGSAYANSTGGTNILDLTATKDRLGYWNYSGYDAMRRRIAETNANGAVTRYDYCNCGALRSITNAWNTAAQLVTSFNYDDQGNRTYVYLPDDTLITWYDALGRQTTNADGWGARYFYYNNQGLLKNISNAYGTEQSTVFDIEDRPISMTDANGVTITNTYDLLGRLTNRTCPDGGVEGFGYSARGLIAYTNQLGSTIFYAYDEAGRKTFETNANSELIQFRYDPSGSLTNLIDGKGQTTKWNHDEYGRVTNKLDQAGTEILRYKYDPDSRLTNRWSVAKGDTNYKYDPVGNLTNVDYALSADVAFQYDALNRATKMVDVVGTTTYTYAKGGQLWTEDGPWSSDTVTNSYSNRLRTALSLAQPTGAWTNGFGYDPAKRLTNVTSQAGSFAYTLGGASSASPLSKKISLPNTSYITNTYDSVARLTGTWLKKNDGTTLDSYTYVYNAGNQRTEVTRTDASTYDFTYDAIGQLKIANGSVNSEDRGYTYDAAWNLNYRTNNGVLSTFVVDSKNELTNSTPGGVSSYDGNGNITNSSGVHDVYDYDDENRLVTWAHFFYNSSTPTNGDLWTDFFYDGLGRLRKRMEYSFVGNQTGPSGSGWATNSETRYVYDGWRVIQERDGSNVPTVSYTRGTDLSAPLQGGAGGGLEGAGGIGGLLARSHGYSSGNWSTHNFYHADGNGNITYLVSSSQALAASYRYDPYGNLISSSGTLASANVYRSSSKEIHVNSGLYYYGYRWYAPNLQRWLNRDPLGEDQDINLYCYVINNPASQVDPWGLALWKCTRSTDWGIGQHVYLWDDRPGQKTSCGRGGGMFTGRGMNKRRDRGPKEDTCVQIPNSSGKEQKVMDCCRKPRGHVFIPLVHDCHDWFGDCLKNKGLPDPEIYGRFYDLEDLLLDYKIHIFIGGPWPGGPAVISAP